MKANWCDVKFHRAIKIYDHCAPNPYEKSVEGSKCVWDFLAKLDLWKGCCCREKK